LDKDIELAYKKNQNSDKSYIQLEIVDGKLLNEIYRGVSKIKTVPKEKGINGSKNKDRIIKKK
jgi:hypothetical protein